MKALMMDAAMAAGRIQLQYFKKGVDVTLKAKDDPVTVADKKCEQKIISMLKKTSYNVIGEESGTTENNSEYTWIIDPIDGTANFSRGIPFFCVSIGLAKNNELVAGVIYSPVFNELFFAQKGKGATLNGKKIKVKNQKNNVISFGKGNDKKAQARYVKAAKKVANGFPSTRSVGAVALELAYTAAGKYDACLSYGDQIWDYAAGILIAKEAGCKVTQPSGKKWKLGEADILVARASVHKKLLELL
ncbi:MAG: inositol monophosphatase family protein [Candidatus Woesearchaeota archaeon]|nr:inositol monophosphatase family protein [Candidatus Woesearchaeota archaeon]